MQFDNHPSTPSTARFETVGAVFLKILLAASVLTAYEAKAIMPSPEPTMNVTADFKENSNAIVDESRSRIENAAGEMKRKCDGRLPMRASVTRYLNLDADGISRRLYIDGRTETVIEYLDQFDIKLGAITLVNLNGVDERYQERAASIEINVRCRQLRK